jgi:hypothetical protein
MAHGTDQAIAGLGDGSVIGTGGNVADADNRLAALASIFDIEASEVDVLDTEGFYTGTDVEAALNEIGESISSIAGIISETSDEVQTITLSSFDEGDTVNFTFNGHESTSVLTAGAAGAATAAAVRTALISVSDFADVETADIVVTGTGPYTVTFGGRYANTDMGAITVTSGTGSATGTVAETTKGGQPATLETYRPRFSQITADSAARNATTTLADSGLTVTLPAVGTYELDAVVMYITAAAADISFKWGGTATVTATVGTSDIVAYPGALAGGDGSTPGLGILLPTSWTTESETPFANTGAHTATPVYFKGILTATAVGTIKLQFTQGTSDVSDTKVKAGSWMKVQRVA